MTLGGGALGLIVALALLTLWFLVRWWQLGKLRPAEGGARPYQAIDLLTGFVTNFFDTLGIGSFAPTTAIFKLRARMPDENIPGTLNVGHTLPTVAEALIFISLVTVDAVTLIGMIAAAVAGAWLGAGIVSRLPRRAVRFGMGVALLIAAVLFLAANLEWMPAGGDALGLTGSTLVFAIGANFVLGALMTTRYRSLCAVPDTREPAWPQPDRGVPDHDGFLRLPDADRRHALRARGSL